MTSNVPAAAAVAPQFSDNQPRFVLRCGSLFLGLENSARVASADRARKLTRSEVDGALKLLKRPGSKFAMPWTIEPADAQGGAR